MTNWGIIKLHNLDSKSLSLSSGPSWQKDKKTTFSVPFIVNISKIRHINKYYSVSKGISPQIRYKYAPNLSFSTSLSLNHKDYYKAPLKESNSYTFSPSSKYFINQSSWMSFGGYLGKEDSKTETSSNKSKGLNLGYFKAYSKKMNIFLSTSINNTDYDGIEVAYSKSREDTSKSLSGNFSYFLDGIKSNLSFNVSYTKNNSNIEMYDYDRKQMGITLSRSF